MKYIKENRNLPSNVTLVADNSQITKDVEINQDVIDELVLLEYFCNKATCYGMSQIKDTIFSWFSKLSAEGLFYSGDVDVAVKSINEMVKDWIVYSSSIPCDDLYSIEIIKDGVEIELEYTEQDIIDIVKAHFKYSWLNFD